MERRAKTFRWAIPWAGKGLLLLLAWLALGAMGARAATTTTVTYVYTNAQGTPLARADAQGNIIARYSYRPYGTQQTGPTNRGPGYTGHVNDPDTGLVYMQQRYYDPSIGRFISPDPVGPAPGNVFNFGRYTYANNNPVVNIDPDGRQVIESPEDFIHHSSLKCRLNPDCRYGFSDENNGKITATSPAAARAAAGKDFLDANYTKLIGKYPSPKAAAQSFGSVFSNESKKLAIEFGANIVIVFQPGHIAYKLTDFVVTQHTFFNTKPIQYGVLDHLPGRSVHITYWGWVHTHSTVYGGFSKNDLKISIGREINAYVMLPDGSYQSFDYSKYDGQSLRYVYNNQNEFGF